MICTQRLAGWPVSKGVFKKQLRSSCSCNCASVPAAEAYLMRVCCAAPVLQVYCSPAKRKVLDLLGLPDDHMALLVDDPRVAAVHVDAWGMRGPEELRAFLEENPGVWRQAIAIRPTGALACPPTPTGPGHGPLPLTSKPQTPVRGAAPNQLCVVLCAEPWRCAWAS